VTADYGIYSASGHVADNDYLTDARTGDGSLVVIYTPILRTFTVDISQLAGPAAAHWFDPAAGIYHAVPGSPLTNHHALNFTPPANNADGDGGWVLVLETIAPTLRIFLEGTNAVLAWPISTPAFQLQQNTSLAGTNWATMTNQVQVVGSENQVMVAPSFAPQFFRLQYP